MAVTIWCNHDIVGRWNEKCMRCLMCWWGGRKWFENNARKRNAKWCNRTRADGAERGESVYDVRARRSWMWEHGIKWMENGYGQKFIGPGSYEKSASHTRGSGHKSIFHGKNIFLAFWTVATRLAARLFVYPFPHTHTHTTHCWPHRCTHLLSVRTRTYTLYTLRKHTLASHARVHALRATFESRSSLYELLCAVRMIVAHL